MRCYFCRETFDEQPYYGCCSRCYCNNANARCAVDEATPQTLPRDVYGDAGLGLPVTVDGVRRFF